MIQNHGFSLLQPAEADVEYRRLPDNVMHDLGLDDFCREISGDAAERRMIANVLSNISSDPSVAVYRRQIFGDVFRLPKLRETMMELFDRIQFMRDFSGMHKTSDEEMGLWHLFNRLDDLDSYIKIVETMRSCLFDERIESEGLKLLRAHISKLYEDACFADMKKDIDELKMEVSDVRSVTLGVNVNERFEAVSIGLVSVNKKPFKKSGIVSNFADAVTSKDRIRETSDWDGDMHYQPISQGDRNGIIEGMNGGATAAGAAIQSAMLFDGRTGATTAGVAADDAARNVTFYLDNMMNKMLGSLVKKLRDTLTKYANIAIVDISGLVPEFLYYIRCAEFIGRLKEKGCVLSEAMPETVGEASMEAEGFYNLKLAMKMENVGEIVPNDLFFDKKHTVYILTGANRGGKTTITQAVGQLFVLAQGGLFVPAKSFRYVPCDCIYTHFPADEDKTMDLGRLGEECVRFKEIFSLVTDKSLLLLNETFSTTSFEEGYYIARDSVKALLIKGVRTIYNTHMHKLGEDVEELTNESSGTGAASLIMKNEESRRTFKVVLAKPEGSSFARDIAEKYGVTYDMLIGE